MILLTGSTGMIGRNIREMSEPMLCPTRQELDLTNREMVQDYLRATKPDRIIHCASNDGEESAKEKGEEICLFDNLRMFKNLADSGIPMITFCTGREIEDRSYKNGEYVLSKHIIKELSLNSHRHIRVIQIWGCFGKYERSIRFLASNIERIKKGLPILVGENKLFSYVYVKDLVKIIQRIENLTLTPFHTNRVVGYTASLLDYANVLKDVSGSLQEIIIEKENNYHSYVGKNNVDFEFTPLEQAIKEYWDEVK